MRDKTTICRWLVVLNDPDLSYFQWANS